MKQTVKKKKKKKKNMIVFLSSETHTQTVEINKLRRKMMNSSSHFFFFLFSALLTTTAIGRRATGDDAPYRDPRLPIEARISDLLSRMTLAEKIGQMTQIDRSVASFDVIRDLSIGSVLNGGDSAPSPDWTPSMWADMVDGYQRAALSSRLGIPMIYGTDAVHGHNNVFGSTVFPHNIGLGATSLQESSRKPTAVDEMMVKKKKKVGGAFHPFHGEKNTSKAQAAATSSTAETRRPEEKDGRKARRCWSPELHRRFLQALQQLGGPHGQLDLLLLSCG